ncbi:DNA polymerase IV [Celerinatantimonas sp. YJH-8]|uniref:DNA polymerase IV n=1 Tax=Celerinatantimonas sp. YJH-8 TaxID=3228714 RepID=UPI0038C98CD2
MRKIIHIDMDCFYAAVEMRENPSLKDKPIAVGGAVRSRGVIATCNYPARKFGIHSAMSTAQALKLCPDLVLLRGQMDLYRSISEQIRAIFLSYTPLVEPLSLDEAYLDVSDIQVCQGSATLMAKQIRAQIFRDTGLTASAGVAPNKFLAKIASEENKPDGLFVIRPDQAAEFARQMILRKIPGVGPKTSERLEAYGLKTGADVLQYAPEQLQQWFGKFGPVLHQRAQGIDLRAVEVSRIRKSVGVEHTYPNDLVSLEQCFEALKLLLPELQHRLRGRLFKGVQVKLKFQDFLQTTVACQSHVLDNSELQALLEKAYERGEGKHVRLIGISVNLTYELQRQLNLFDDLSCPAESERSF